MSDRIRNLLTVALIAGLGGAGIGMAVAQDHRPPPPAVRPVPPARPIGHL